MNVINNNFDAVSNLAISRLMARADDRRKARVNRKNGESSLDSYFQFIHAKWVKGKSLTQILVALKNEHKVEISKSALSRFIKSKFRGNEK